MRGTRAIILTLALAGIAVGLGAQAPAFKRTVVQQGDLASIPGREAVTAVVDFEPGAAIARHTHPGEEVGFVVEGTLAVEQDGKPAETVTAGHAFLIPAGTIHKATNSGKVATKVLSTYVVEKGKPLATFVPAPAK